MSKFRKKPVEIEAAKVADIIQFTQSDDWKVLPKWVCDAYEQGLVVIARDHIFVHTLEGTMTADHDDWLLRGIKGEIYPCKPDIFDATYEAVVEPKTPTVDAGSLIDAMRSILMDLHIAQNEGNYSQVKHFADCMVFHASQVSIAAKHLAERLTKEQGEHADSRR